MAIVFGGLLTLLGLVGYFGATLGWFSAGHASPTALIPVAFGILLFTCGILAANPSYRMHAMHAAAVVALLGVIGAIVRPIMLMARGALVVNAAFVTQIVMALLCVIFLILCIRSFVAARKAREAGVTQ